jgi:hypothetical protein
MGISRALKIPSANISFAGCRTIADRILRARKLRMDADGMETAEATEEASRNATDIAT